MTGIMHTGEIQVGDTVNFHGLNMFGDAINGWKQADEVHLVLTVFEQDNRLKGRTADAKVYDLEKDLLDAYDVTSVALRKGARA